MSVLVSLQLRLVLAYCQDQCAGSECYFAYVREAQYQQQQQKSQSCLTHVTHMCHDMPGLGIMAGRLGDRFACSLRGMLAMDHRLGIRFLGRCSASKHVRRHGGWTIPLYPQKYKKRL